MLSPLTAVLQSINCTVSYDLIYSFMLLNCLVLIVCTNMLSLSSVTVPLDNFVSSVCNGFLCYFSGLWGTVSLAIFTK